MSIPPSHPSSGSSGILTLVPVHHQHRPHGPEWQPILHSSNQVVLYNPHSHALSVARAPHLPRRPCPYCKQPLPSGFVPSLQDDDDEERESVDGEINSADRAWNDDEEADEDQYTRTSDYFQLLAIANETASRPTTPTPSNRRGSIRGANGKTNGNDTNGRAFTAEAMAEGYFKTFFQEEYKLGMGANGSVYLCQHVLDGNPLGHFAVKKIAVGESHSYLLKILREVRLLERLHHPNIITYHHAWLETAQFSSFGPKVPTLHVLMQWAEGGSLDDFIDVRLGRKPQHVHINPLAPFTSMKSPSPSPSPGDLGTPPPQEIHSRSARIRAFRAYQRAPPSEKARLKSLASHSPPQWTAVHLLSADEVKSLFKDVVEGLAFLHDKSILHLDLKPGNVLLTWDEGRLIPRAMLSDFGTSRDMINTSRFTRSGNTGTLEYTSPESLPSPATGLLQQIDSKSDMWSLGMILHKLLFFKLPYRYAAEGDAAGGPVSGDVGRDGEESKLRRLEREVLEYPGFKSNMGLQTSFEARRLPRSFLVLLESLLNKVPLARPSVDRVAGAIRDGKLDPLQESPLNLDASSSVLVPVMRPQLSTPPPSEIRAESEVPEGDGERDSEEMVNERMQLLGLPSPPLQVGQPLEEKWWWKGGPGAWGRRGMGTFGAAGGAGGGGRGRRRMWMRMCKSCLMAAKVLTLPSLCPSPSRSRLWLSTLLLAAAVFDTAMDFPDERQAVWTSAVLGAFHVLVVSLITRSGVAERWACAV